ncbi:MAG: hypothetical protein ACTSXY_12330 [Promethearchaeota archaeon]
MKIKYILFFGLLLISFVSATSVGVLDSDFTKGKVIYSTPSITFDNSTAYVNNSEYWDGNAWSDIRWLNIDGSNANQDIDIGGYNFHANDGFFDYLNFSFLISNFGGGIDATGDPWYLSGIDFQIAENLIVNKNLKGIGQGSYFNSTLKIEGDNPIAEGNATLIINSNVNDYACINLTEGDGLGFTICNDGSGDNRLVFGNYASGFEYMWINRDDGTIHFNNDTTFTSTFFETINATDWSNATHSINKTIYELYNDGWLSTYNETYALEALNKTNLSYVPYTGATSNLNLGTDYDIICRNLRGVGYATAGALEIGTGVSGDLLTSSTGQFDFDNNNIITTGTITSGHNVVNQTADSVGTQVNGYDDMSGYWYKTGILSNGRSFTDFNGVIHYFKKGGASIGYMTSSSILAAYDGKQFAIGSTTATYGVLKSSNEQTNTAVLIGLGDGATGSRSLLITDTGDRAYNFAHPVQSNPTLFLQSANQVTDEWASLSHDSSNFIMNISGNGSLVIKNSTGYGHILTGEYFEGSALFDISKGSALEQIKNSSEYRKKDGSLDHKKHYAYSQIEVVDGSRPEVREVCVFDELEQKEVCGNETYYPHKKQEDVLSMSDRIATLEQAIYELKIENQDLLKRIEVLEK